VEGLAIALVPATEVTPPVEVPAYSDICYDCGLVCLYVRVGHAEKRTESPTRSSQQSRKEEKPRGRSRG
jgi:hypothetical protein